MLSGIVKNYKKKIPNPGSICFVFPPAVSPSSFLFLSLRRSRGETVSPYSTLLRSLLSYIIQSPKQVFNLPCHCRHQYCQSYYYPAMGALALPLVCSAPSFPCSSSQLVFSGPTFLLPLSSKHSML